jgi:hypothetical protein
VHTWNCDQAGSEDLAASRGFVSGWIGGGENVFEFPIEPIGPRRRIAFDLDQLGADSQPVPVTLHRTLDDQVRAELLRQLLKVSWLTLERKRCARPYLQSLNDHEISDDFVRQPVDKYPVSRCPLRFSNGSTAMMGRPAGRTFVRPTELRTAKPASRALGVLEDLR